MNYLQYFYCKIITTMVYFLQSGIKEAMRGNDVVL